MNLKNKDFFISSMENMISTQDNMDSLIGKEDNSLKESILQLLDWSRYLWIKRFIILSVVFLGSVIGLWMSIASKPTYTAKLNFVLEDSKGGVSNLGGIAALAGINLGGGGGGLFQGDNILELYKSRTMLTRTLLSPLKETNELLIERYINMKELREMWKDSALKHISFDGPLESFSLQQDSLIGLFIKDIRNNILSVRKPDKMLSLIEVQVISEDELFSKAFTESLVANVTDFYVNTRTQKEQENLSILQHQVDSVRTILNDAIAGVAIALDSNPNSNPARRSITVNSTQRQVDVQANQAILTELVKNLELAKITLRKESPLIQIVDSPILPLEEIRLGKVKGILIGGLVGGFLIVSLLISLKYYKTIMEK